MAEPSSAAGTQRVVLLARPGKAADNLVEALRQSGADLVLVADPNALDEATLLAARPQAVLVALEPGIEPAVDRLDSVLSSPSLTVIFDEADLAAHRAGWDAARWVRHLSAKLNRHQRVLPPGGEAETEEWYPSPGHLPTPSSAFVDLDMDAFAQEAAARAGSVPTDGMSSDTAQPTASIETLVEAPAHALPAVGSQGGDPWGDDAGLDVASRVVSASSSNAPQTVAAEVAPEPTPEPARSEAREIDAFDLDGFDLGALDIDTAEADAADSADVDSVEGDHVETDSVRKDAVQIDTARMDAIEMGALEMDMVEMDAVEIDTLDIDATNAESAEAAETVGIEERASTAGAPSVHPIQFDDDAFFIESLSADATSPNAFADAPTFEVAAPRFDDAPALSIAPDFDLDTTTSKTPSVPPPLPVAPQASEPTTKEPLGFALDDFADSPQRANNAAPPASDPRSTARNLDLSSLEARISGLSLVDIETSTDTTTPKDMPAYVDFTEVEAAHNEPASANLAAAHASVSPEVVLSSPTSTWEAPPSPPSAVASMPSPPPFAPPSDIGRGLVVIEAGLGGPDPVRQVLAGLPSTFPMPVLVRLHLQGGRYDRLVAQMERAASLPVMLAEVGDFVRTGCIYFLPEGIGLNALPGGFEFIAHPSPALTIFAALPAQDSAMLFLSGSDAGLIEDAMQAVDDGALIVAQSPEDCYDGAACAYLRSRGAASGLPPELAARLVARWPS